MTKVQDPSGTEKVVGHPATQLALAGLASVIASPTVPLVAVSALVPVLASTFASSRHKQRVDDFISAVADTLQKLETKVRHLSDVQYKLVNEAILAALQTTQQEKLDLLKQVVRNSIELTDLDDQSSVFLSRVVRDISIEEVRLLKETFHCGGILLYGPPFGLHDGDFRVDPNSTDALVVAGLLSLGVLVPGGTTFGGPPVLEFSRGAGKLMALLKTQ